MEDFGSLLEQSVANHGHCCPGQVLGVRMAMVGSREVGINDPKSSRDLIVYVEIDRCATDAIQSVTGCKLGKRTLKYLDYGKMAATFYNVRENIAVRVLARDDSREKAKHYGSPEATKKEAQTLAYREMDEEDLFVITSVRLHLRMEDLPGHPLSRVMCERCGEGINDQREVIVAGQTLCKACADGAYYQTCQKTGKPSATEKRNGSDGPVPVVAVIGFSNSGKTRVAATLVKTLTAQGLKVAAIKHCHDGHEPARKDSDSDRLYGAGAVVAIASSPDKRSLVERVKDDSSLGDLVGLINTPLDLVIAEGFKTSSVPKILVLDGAKMDDSVTNIIATIGDDFSDLGLPNFSFNDLEELAEWLTNHFVKNRVLAIT